MGGFKQWLIEKLEMGDMEEPDYMPEMQGPQELLDAEKRCPDVRFVKSCREFYERRGFLSEAQRRALTFAGTPDRRRRQFGY